MDSFAFVVLFFALVAKFLLLNRLLIQKSRDLQVMMQENCYDMIRYDTVFKDNLNPNTMSSNMRLVKVCESCKIEFVAKTTVTQCCSDACAKRLYRLKKRNEAISQAKLKTEIKRKPEAFIDEDQIKFNFERGCFAFECIAVNLEEMGTGWKVISKKIGKKHLFDNKNFLLLK